MAHRMIVEEGFTSADEVRAVVERIEAGPHPLDLPPSRRVLIVERGLVVELSQPEVKR